VIGFGSVHAGYVIGLNFPAPVAARLSATRCRRDDPQKSTPRRSWRLHYLMLALYETVILGLLVIVTLFFRLFSAFSGNHSHLLVQF
jgi:hypothetical protein